MVQLDGSCYCGGVQVRVELSRSPESFQPRACDCDFCRKNGASYISDPVGSMNIEAKDRDAITGFRQGSENAEFMFCKTCAVLVGVVYRESESVFGAVNSEVFGAGKSFGEKVTASPKTLSGAEKVARWKLVWFPKVSFQFRD